MLSVRLFFFSDNWSTCAVMTSSDAVIESYVGIPVKEIFRQKNEEAFRELEVHILFCHIPP